VVNTGRNDDPLGATAHRVILALAITVHVSALRSPLRLGAFRVSLARAVVVFSRACGFPLGIKAHGV